MVLAAEKMNTERITVTDLLPIVGFKRMIHCEIINIDLKICMVHKKGWIPKFGIDSGNIKTLIQLPWEFDFEIFNEFLKIHMYVDGAHTRVCMPFKIPTYGFSHS